MRIYYSQMCDSTICVARERSGLVRGVAAARQEGAALKPLEIATDRPFPPAHSYPSVMRRTHLVVFTTVAMALCPPSAIAQTAADIAKLRPAANRIIAAALGRLDAV